MEATLGSVICRHSQVTVLPDAQSAWCCQNQGIGCRAAASAIAKKFDRLHDNIDSKIFSVPSTFGALGLAVGVVFTYGFSHIKRTSLLRGQSRHMYTRIA